MNYTQKDYYTEMTVNEFTIFIYDKQIDFNLRDINRLKILNDKFKKDNYIANYIYIDELLEIYECENEWFMINDYKNYEYYKCDQIDGLIYCLKNKGFI